MTMEPEFQREVRGDEFLDLYEAYTELGVDPSDAAGMTPAQLHTTTDADRASWPT
ncbi:hypothetical protein ACFXPY_44105 [Streptomyces sp. NPDC059153]|uniref:hypothetical protein n=1 Tax=unclassified Streptomyces TaxID=2593676 RepID=UPI0036895C3E